MKRLIDLTNEEARAHFMKGSSYFNGDLPWDTCKEDFRGDGSLRDIYITPSTLADWRVLYPKSASPMLRFRVGQALVVFHFFSEDEIECDFVPNEITSQGDLDALLGFVRQLGDTTRKRVVITPENRRERPFITYDSESREFEHHVEDLLQQGEFGA